MPAPGYIVIRNATENNLKSVCLEIPKHELIVVTGVSGSGKSSLVFDVLYREAESRFFGSFSSQARQFIGKLKRPGVESIEGLPAAIAVDQKSVVSNPRSTVGTITGIWDLLRLLFARTGTPDDPAFVSHLSRSLFSFNTPEGACPQCKGLGVEDRIDPGLFIADETKTLREGALTLSTPNGYIIYSQVTIDVLDQVLQSEGFSVDIPWKELSPEQKHIVLYGSDKIEIPFGKHPLESRMRWSGITAKPRELGHYKGILPVMEAILNRERNKNILRFVRTCTCPACEGTRLNPAALSVRVGGRTIADLASMQLSDLTRFLQDLNLPPGIQPVAGPIIRQIALRTGTLEQLGLGYLPAGRDSITLSAGESRRLRLAGQAGTGLSGILYIFDEPSVGLHPRDTGRLLKVIRNLRDEGNTVIVVEHDDAFIRHADRVIDIGPAAGRAGGEVLFNEQGKLLTRLGSEKIAGSRTLAFLQQRERFETPPLRRPGKGVLTITGAAEHNLKQITVSFLPEAFNVVTGVSGAGKSTLTHTILGRFLQSRLHGSGEVPGKFQSITGWDAVSKVIRIDQSPIGRTPRSNPATYTGLSDTLRDLFALQPLAVERGFGRSRFSFNTGSGRCESCQGAGFRQIGMHFMGDVEIPCETCEGKRFNPETLEVSYHGKNISDVLDLSVDEALEFLQDQPAAVRYLKSLASLGLGYLRLGQRSSTLSGGEAQRVKLASELARPQSAHTLYILDEPTTGLHNADVKNLLAALNGLVDQGHTVILIEHHPGLILAADRVIDLGPEGGNEGGFLVFSGTPEELIRCGKSYTGKALKEYLETEGGRTEEGEAGTSRPPVPQEIRLTGVVTNNLQSVDVVIPHHRITVITGVSGSGKSSLAFDTLFAEAHNRFLQSFSAYLRNHLGVKEQADFAEATGLTPALAVDQHLPSGNPRSTVGTLTGLQDFLRLLFARVAVNDAGETAPSSSYFSFNHTQGACPACDGLGTVTGCDPGRLITHPEKPILNGAMDGTKTGRFYGDPDGQYVATMKSVGQSHGIDFTLPWERLDEPARKLLLYGAGDEEYDVTWEYRREERTGQHHFRGSWPGLIELVNREYVRKHADHRGDEMMALMQVTACPACEGSRLGSQALGYRISGTSLADLNRLPVSQLLEWIEKVPEVLTDALKRQAAVSLSREIGRRLKDLCDLGLGHLDTGSAVSALPTGEAHRVRLAGQTGSGLSGLTYILDEPAAGLHPSGVSRLMGVIRKLRDAGNTVVLVEHNTEVIRAADHVIDLGPGAGRNGGHVLAVGTPAEIAANPASVTGKYLTRAPDSRDVFQTGPPVASPSTDGFERFSRVVNIRSRTRFTGPAGTVATYTGLFDPVRDLFARTAEAVAAGLKKSHFSYLDRNGRCPGCEGAGYRTVSLDFLSDVHIPCETCGGQRYRPEVLACRFREKNIREVLNMTVDEAALFFDGHRNIVSRLEILQASGLGYLEAGQPLETLSGGESRRLELAAELMKPAKGHTLYLIAEPFSGLHPDDFGRLQILFEKLAAQGHEIRVADPGTM